MKLLNVATCFTTGIRLANSNLLQFVRFNLLIFALFFFVSYLAAILGIKLTYNRRLQELMVIVVTFPVMIYAGAGALYYYLSYTKGVVVRLSKLYRGYRWFLNFAKFGFLVLMVYQLVFVPALRYQEYELEEQVRLLAGGFFFFWLVIRLFFLPILFIDFDDNFERSLFESMRLSKGYFVNILLFIACAAVVLSVGFFLAGAGLLYATAIVLLGYIKFYDMVKANDTGQH